MNFIELTTEQLDVLLYQFLVTYQQWCETDVNPYGYNQRRGLCNNARRYQLQIERELGEYYHVFALWDHMAGYFKKDFQNYHYPFGMDDFDDNEDNEDAYVDLRENPDRMAWVVKMIKELSND